MSGSYHVGQTRVTQQIETTFSTSPLSSAGKRQENGKEERKREIKKSGARGGRWEGHNSDGKEKTGTANGNFCRAHFLPDLLRPAPTNCP